MTLLGQAFRASSMDQCLAANANIQYTKNWRQWISHTQINRDWQWIWALQAVIGSEPYGTWIPSFPQAIIAIPNGSYCKCCTWKFWGITWRFSIVKNQTKPCLQMLPVKGWWVSLGFTAKHHLSANLSGLNGKHHTAWLFGEHGPQQDSTSWMGNKKKKKNISFDVLVSRKTTLNISLLASRCWKLTAEEPKGEKVLHM